MPKITDLPNKISSLPKQKKDLFKRFFDVTSSTGRLSLPDPMKPWVIKTFKKVDRVKSQKIVRVDNLITFEGALFNELRAERPKDAKSDDDISKVIREDKNMAFRNPAIVLSADRCIFSSG